jgi:hypothetical protein
MTMNCSSVGALEPVDARDVRVIQAGEELRFALEADHSVGVGAEGVRAGS